MTTLITVFTAALAIAFCLTPVVRRAALRTGILNRSSRRQAHQGPVPRAGGIAVYVAFVVPFVGAASLHVGLGRTIQIDESFLAFVAGATLVFGLGVRDDLRTLSARRKLIVQALAALVAYLGGIRIVAFTLPLLGTVELGLLSFPVTLFWFLLLVNALNLIDGLDGLAAGISFFATVVLLIALGPEANPLVALALAATGGATLGFLRYNFNPASIFLGDGGSYLLGYNLAAMSALGAVKAEATIGLLIPVIALGVPLMDALWAPLRRFILGRRLFVADRDHIHHRLLAFGYTHRRAVLLLYGASVAMGLLALLLVHARDERVALTLIVVGAAATLAIRKLGYLEFVKSGDVRRWIGGVTDDLGIARERRRFLAREIRVAHPGSVEDLWTQVSAMAKALDLDACDLGLAESPEGVAPSFRYRRAGGASGTGWDPSRAMHLSLPLADPFGALGIVTVTIEMSGVADRPNLFRRLDQMQRSLVDGLSVIRSRSQVA